MLRQGLVISLRTRRLLLGSLLQAKGHRRVRSFLCSLKTQKDGGQITCSSVLSLTPYSEVCSVLRWRHDILLQIDKTIVRTGKQILASPDPSSGMIVIFAHREKRSPHAEEMRKPRESRVEAVHLPARSVHRVRTIQHALVALSYNFRICNS